MPITHQTVLGEDGKPTAAIIPWDVFESSLEIFGDDADDGAATEWRDEIRRLADEIDEDRVELVDGSDLLRRLRTL